MRKEQEQKIGQVEERAGASIGLRNQASMFDLRSRYKMLE